MYLEKQCVLPSPYMAKLSFKETVQQRLVRLKRWLRQAGANMGLDPTCKSGCASSTHEGKGIVGDECCKKHRVLLAPAMIYSCHTQTKTVAQHLCFSLLSTPPRCRRSRAKHQLGSSTASCAASHQQTSQADDVGRGVLLSAKAPTLVTQVHSAGQEPMAVTPSSPDGCAHMRERQPTVRPSTVMARLPTLVSWKTPPGPSVTSACLRDSFGSPPSSDDRSTSAEPCPSALRPMAACVLSIR